MILVAGECTGDISGEGGAVDLSRAEGGDSRLLVRQHLECHFLDAGDAFAPEIGKCFVNDLIFLADIRPA